MRIVTFFFWPAPWWFRVAVSQSKDDAEWKTVQNAAMVIAQTANLITLPGRLREDGKPVPVQNADWNKFASDLAAGQGGKYTGSPDDKKQLSFTED